MKNIEKWIDIRDKISSLSRHNKIEMDIKEIQKRIVKRNKIPNATNNQEYNEIEIGFINGAIWLSSWKLGDYTKVVFRKKKRLNVVEICFLIQLYNEQIKTIMDENKKTISFELKSFWKMSKAIELVGDLSSEILKQQLELQRLRCKYTEPEQQEKLDKAINFVNTLKILPPENGKIQICFSNDGKFTINSNNVKLNIIPLCKLLVQYYVEFINNIDACESFVKLVDEAKIAKAKSNMRSLMEKYFASGVNY